MACPIVGAHTRFALMLATVTPICRDMDLRRYFAAGAAYLVTDLVPSSEVS